MAWGMIVSSASLFGMLLLALYGDYIEESIVADQKDQETGPVATPQKDQAPKSQPAASLKHAA